MRSPFRNAWALAMLAAPLAASAAPPVPSRSTMPAPPHVIGTHQIDRYDAISSIQDKLKADPKSLADWVILGELAHEVAMDAPPEPAARYFRMSREAYESALKLAPDNMGLQAAVQFSRDQEAGADSFEKSRDRATESYLSARRRELAATGYVPSIRAYSPPLPSRELPGPAPAPVPLPTAGTVTTPGNPSASQVAAADGVASPATAPAITSVPAPGAVRAVVDPNAVVGPAQRNAVDTDTANFGTRQIFSPAVSAYPTYQPYYVPQGQPLTYQQYTSGYYPSNAYAPGVQPMTAQGYLQQTYTNAAAGTIGGPALAPGLPAPGATVPAVPRR